MNKITKLFILAVVLLMVVAATACNEEGDGGTEAAGRETPPPTAAPEPSVLPTEGDDDQQMRPVRVWLEREGTLFPVTRSSDAFPALGRAAVEDLLEGPTAEEAEVGVGSAVPEGTELLALTISEGTATVDLTEAFEEGAGSLAIRLRVAQVVYTLTEFPTVDDVAFRVEGEPARTFSSEGLVLDDPQRRKGFKDLLPPIVVYEPGIGDEVDSSFTIRGTANVFEATVEVRLLIDGEEVVHGFTTATCGTGCRGSYEHSLKVEVSEPTEAVLEVFESSAEDGSPLHVVRIPLEISPS